MPLVATPFPALAILWIISLLALVIAVLTLFLCLQRAPGSQRNSPIAVIGVVVLVIMVLASVFAVVQPLLWRWLFPKTIAPTSVTDLASLMTIVVTLMSLLVASTGTLLYLAIRDRLQQDLLGARNTLQLEIAQARQRDSYLIDGLTGTSTLAVGQLGWAAYEQPWLGTGFDPEFEQDPAFIEFLGLAVINTETAVRYLEKARNDLQEVIDPTPDPKRQAFADFLDKQLAVAKGTLAYVLATRRKGPDIGEALGLAYELWQPGISHNRLETIAWVLLRCSQDENERKRAFDLVEELTHNPEVPAWWQERITRKYATLFPGKV